MKLHTRIKIAFKKTKFAQWWINTPFLIQKQIPYERPPIRWQVITGELNDKTVPESKSKIVRCVEWFYWAWCSAPGGIPGLPNWPKRRGRNITFNPEIRGVFDSYQEADIFGQQFPQSYIQSI